MRRARTVDPTPPGYASGPTRRPSAEHALACVMGAKCETQGGARAMGWEYWMPEGFRVALPLMMHEALRDGKPAERAMFKFWDVPSAD